MSLVDFIKEVKSELRAAVDNDDPFFEMGEVELEVTFALDISGKTGVKLVVAELGGETKATQTHKVKLKLHPFVEEEAPSQLVLDSAKGMTKTTTQQSHNARVKTAATRALPHTKATLKYPPKASTPNSKPTASKQERGAVLISRPKAG
ncbi:hypothetical protein U724_15815 [Pseudomonas chlororaphis subsp. aurantiaca PB-St2]|nr:hypothetical protein U724_15815 [Pseudomonas chlororaphis subsp. aurantiaca PB-St2]